MATKKSAREIRDEIAQQAKTGDMMALSLWSKVSSFDDEIVENIYDEFGGDMQLLDYVFHQLNKDD